MAKSAKPKQMIQRIFRVAQLLAQTERSQQLAPPSKSSDNCPTAGKNTKS